MPGGELVIDKDLVISGPGADQLTISGNNNSRVFFINPGAPGATSPPIPPFPVVHFANLTITDGKAKGGDGGAGNNFPGGGGGAAGMGGGLFINGGEVTIDHVTFARNLAIGGNGTALAGPSFGGGGGGGSPLGPGAAGGFGGGGGGGLGGAVFVRQGTLILLDNTFTENSAARGNGGSATGPGAVSGAVGQGKGGAIFINAGNFCKRLFDSL